MCYLWLDKLGIERLANPSLTSMSAHAALADESHLMSCLILKSHVALFPEIDVLCHIVLLLPLFLLDSPLTYRLLISEDGAKEHNLTIRTNLSR